jgi:propionyl-CoA carboxylase beta chain
MQEKFDLLQKMQDEAMLGGGIKRIESQHKKGKLTARERLHFLIDEGTFEEIGMFVTHRASEFGLEREKYLGDGVVTGYGKINGRLVYVFSQDFTVFGGSLSETHAEKICKIMDLALKNGAPVIGLNDSGGARIQEGVVSLGGYADIFYRNTKASGVVPQISAILGPCAGGAVYSPAITDFIMMVENTSYMFVTGPNVVKTVTHEDVSSEELGGAQTHSSKSGVTHFAFANEIECIQNIKKLVSYMPQNCEETTPKIQYDASNEKREKLNTIIPANANQPYDIREVIEEVVDGQSFMEVHKNFAENIVIGFARIAGRSIGIVANQPAFLAGVLDIHSIFRFWYLKMYQVSCPVPTKNGMQ